MTRDEHYKRVRELFEQAHELPISEREDFLVQSCGTDEVLIAGVRVLLQADADAEDFLGQPVTGPGAGLGSMVGAAIGSYRIEELIASGGMGAVYRARQEHPNRPVALKLIRHGAVNAHLLRRFELESEALGRLDHPGIAQIYEASTARTDDGPLPFFAMELVHGPPLHRFAAEHDLDLRERVELLAKVCDAVHHAHQNGVIHRDLKPANILVRSDGQPKVLDFGVARITDSDVQATTLLTDSGLIIGTLSYMSPEQVRGGHADLDIRADVYALGVVGYELIAGRLPIDLAGKTVTEAALTIENDPPDPLTTVGVSFPSDIQTIIGVCLEKEKQNRYPSATDLAADLRRFLADEPIEARPPGVLYQLSKFARRNRALVAGASLALAALIAGLVVSLAGWSAASQARTRAETEAAKATLLNTYLTDMLQAPDPWADGREVKVVDVLARAAQNLEESLRDQPEVAAMANHRLGRTFMNLGQYEDAETSITRALEISETVSDIPLSSVIDMMTDLGDVYIALGELDRAEDLLQGAFDTASAELGTNDPARIKSVHQLGLVRWEQGKLDEAEELFRQCLTQSLSVLGPEQQETIVTTSALGNVLWYNGKLDEAKPLLERALEWNQTQLGPDHPSTAIVVNNLAFIYQRLEQHDRALEMFRSSLATRLNVHDHDSMSVMVGLNNLGLQLGMMKRNDEALATLEEAMEIAGRIFEPDHPRVLAVRSTYGHTLLNAGRHAEAERELLASFEGFRATIGVDRTRTQAVCRSLVKLYRETGNVELESRFEALIGDAAP